MKKLLVILIGCLLVLGACGSNGEKSEKKSATNKSEQSAETIVKQSCTSCHGNDLKGNIGPDLTTVGDRLSKDEINTILEKGKGGMPPGLVQGEDAEKVASYLADMKSK